MTDKTPAQRLTDAYTEGDTSHTLDTFRATAHDPSRDAETDRRAALLDQLPPSARMSAGYHQSARESAQRLKTTKEN